MEFDEEELKAEEIDFNAYFYLVGFLIIIVCIVYVLIRWLQ